MLNVPERITFQRLNEVCSRHSAQVYAKVRLADVLPIENSAIPASSYEFALRAHYDFVITDLAQRPLFAVEFDGPGHADPAQVDRDDLKEGLSRRFGLPLLRVIAGDLHRSEWRLDRLTGLTEQWFTGGAGMPGRHPIIEIGPAVDASSRGGHVTARPSCPICGSAMMLKDGRYGPFLSCSRFPACKGSCDLPGQAPGPPPQLGVASTPSELLTSRLWLLAGIIGVSLAFLTTLIVITRTRPDQPRPVEPAAVKFRDTEPAPVASRGDDPAPALSKADPATIRQRNLLELLIRRRGWDAAERGVQSEKVLGYVRPFSDLSKREASKLITAWDDRK